jgi:hypothetical protein
MMKNSVPGQACVSHLIMASSLSVERAEIEQPFEIIDIALRPGRFPFRGLDPE